MSVSEELQNLIDSAILNELGQLFELQFTNSVFDHEEYYTSIPEVLKSRGYNLHHTKGEGVHLCKGKLDYHVNFGAFDAVFINDMVERSLGYEHLTGFPVKFSATSLHAGRLANFSTQTVEHFKKLNVTPAQADPMAVRFFKSDEVVENLDHGSIYITERKEVDDLGAFQSFSDEGKLIIDLPTEPGYWRLDIGPTTNRGNKPSTLLMWEKVLIKAKFSFKYVPSLGHLFFSNTQGAKFGLPPTAHHMRWKPLLLRDPEVEEEVIPLPPDDWQEIVEAFRDDPSNVTFLKVLNSFECKIAFKYYNKKRHIGAGSRDIGKKLRMELVGVAKSVTFPEFAKILESVSFPSGLDYYLCNLIKIGNELSYDREGKVYVH